MKGKILIVDDDEIVRDMVCDFLSQSGYEVKKVDGFSSAIEEMKSSEFDIVVLDKNMPGTDGNKEGGLDVLKYIKEHFPTTEAILMTGFPSIESAVETMKLGAFDYITKPFELKELDVKVERALKVKKLVDRVDFQDDVLEEGKHFVFRILKRRADVIYNQNAKLEKIAAITKQLKEKITKGHPAYDLINEIGEMV